MFGFDLTTALDQSSLILIVFKFFFVVAAVLYSLFAVVVIRQIIIMKNTLLTSFSPFMLVAGYAHLLFSLFVVLLFFAIL
ncbi:MAG: hypothetical protein O2840_02210 [bacterium]|nr:hypothetical protein [bacterium]